MVYGSNFAFPNLSSNKVTFGGKKATVELVNQAQLVSVVPEGAVRGPITVSNKFGNYTSSNFFQIKGNPPQPDLGDVPGKGDRKVLSTYLGGFRRAEGKGDKTYYAPPGSILWVTSQPDKNGDVIVRFKENWTDTEVGNDIEDEYNQDSGEKVKPDIPYKINAAHLQECAAKSRGWDYGLLVIPYKFHLNDHTIAGESTVGGYAGWQLNTPGLAVSFVVSAGIGVVPLTTTDEKGAPRTEHAASFTASGGFVFTFSRTGRFQVGILAGSDFTGRGSQYKYDAEPWLAVSFGTDLTK
jgi:hypothetical protein